MITRKINILLFIPMLIGGISNLSASADDAASGDQSSQLHRALFNAPPDSVAACVGEKIVDRVLKQRELECSAFPERPNLTKEQAEQSFIVTMESCGNISTMFTGALAREHFAAQITPTARMLIEMVNGNCHWDDLVLQLDRLLPHPEENLRFMQSIVAQEALAEAAVAESRCVQVAANVSKENREAFLSFLRENNVTDGYHILALSWKQPEEWHAELALLRK